MHVYAQLVPFLTMPSVSSFNVALVCCVVYFSSFDKKTDPHVLCLNISVALTI